MSPNPGDLVTITRKCTECHKDIPITMTEAQAAELAAPRRRHIQHILPTHTPGQRELLISGICDACFDRIFKPMEDEG